MNVVVAGGTGFLGRSLVDALAAERHAIVVLTRGASRSRADRVRFVTWTPDGPSDAFTREIDGADAVVNLAGESIAGARWSPAHKQAILDSRIAATRAIVDAIRSADRPPSVLISGSAVGYYGPHGDEIVTEETPSGSDFLARVCVRWEEEATRAFSSRTRVVCLRTGLVVALDGGALPRMLTPFKFFAGGPVGTGRQYWPWIHKDDWIGLVRWAIDHATVSGAVNATAPNPVTNAAFAAALGAALHRPAVLPAPSFALRLLLGEMADALLLSGQRAVPAKAQRSSFVFRHEDVGSALRDLFSGATRS
jgi:uncharacterized protein (TIGR01777 family)